VFVCYIIIIQVDMYLLCNYTIDIVTSVITNTE